jgi:hypothetical protein
MPTSWEIAKELLKEDIVAGFVTPSMKPSEVFILREEYECVEYTNFRSNLNSLRKKLKKMGKEAEESTVAVAHDRTLYPVRINQPGFKYPRWNGSEAERLLKLDVNDGKNERMLPKQLHETRLAYQAFPLEVFRKHILQEARSRKETPYWLAKKTAIKRKEKMDEPELVLE